MPTGLTHIQDTQIDAATLHNFCHSFSVGPLTIQYRIDITVPQVTADVYLLGVRIGGDTVNLQTTSLTVKGGVSGFKAQVTLRATFSQKTVAYTVELCAPALDSRNYSGTLFSW